MEKRTVTLEEMMPFIEECLGASGSVSFSPRGTSMLPMLREGIDNVTLSPLPERLKKYDISLYCRENGEYVLHRIVKTGDTYTCIGDNQFVPECGVERRRMIAVVSSFTRSGKKYSVGSFAYKIYCRFWHYSRPLRRLLLRCAGVCRSNGKIR